MPLADLAAAGLVEENLACSGLDDQRRQAGQIGEHGADQANSGVVARRIVGHPGLEEFPAERRVGLATTLLQPDSRHGRVASLDIVQDAVALRLAIGLAGQYAAVDEMLTGRENLQLVGQLYRPGRAERRQRAERVLEQFQLADAADRSVRIYRGGMRQRLDLAASLGASRQCSSWTSRPPAWIRARRRPVAADRGSRGRRHHHPADHQYWRKSTGSRTGSEGPA